jgi:DNA-binding HxlR family transcriptional regulator
LNGINIKNKLKNEITKKLKENRRYFTREELVNHIADVQQGTLSRYLVDLNKTGILYRHRGTELKY